LLASGKNSAIVAYLKLRRSRSGGTVVLATAATAGAAAGAATGGSGAEQLVRLVAHQVACEESRVPDQISRRRRRLDHPHRRAAPGIVVADLELAALAVDTYRQQAAVRHHGRCAQHDAQADLRFDRRPQRLDVQLAAPRAHQQRDGRGLLRRGRRRRRRPAGRQRQQNRHPERVGRRRLRRRSPSRGERDPLRGPL
jgi:hypothetical protein